MGRPVFVGADADGAGAVVNDSHIGIVDVPALLVADALT
jgi:hypothetical protein